MGLDMPDEDTLAQDCSTMILSSMTTVQLQHKDSSSITRVFSIPELIESIAKYLRTGQLAKLSLVSKIFFQLFRPQLIIPLAAGAFHDPPYALYGSTHIASDTFCKMAYRVEALKLDLHSSLTDLAQNAMLKCIVEHREMALRRLQIAYWGEDLGVLEQIITQLPNLQDLSVVFKASIHAVALPNMLIRVGRAHRARTMEKEEQTSFETQNSLTRGLQKLSMKMVIAKSVVVKLSCLSDLVDAWPSLTSLEFCSFAFEDSASLLASTTSPPPPPPPNPLHVTGVPVIPIQSHETQQLSGMNIPSGLLREPSYPNIKSIKIAECSISSSTLWTLDRLFPALRELEVSGCSGEWYRVLTGIRTSQITPISTGHGQQEQPNVPFLQLRSLNVWNSSQTSRDKVLGIIRHRPELACVGIDVLPDSREGLLEFAAFCSGIEVNELVSPSELQSDDERNAHKMSIAISDSCRSIPALPFDESKIRNKIKRLAIQTYASPPYAMSTIEKFYNAPAFRSLEYVFVQNSELSLSLFPFTKTLRELEIGGPEECSKLNDVVILNGILHQLPVLEIFKLDRYLPYDTLPLLFKGFERSSWKASISDRYLGRVKTDTLVDFPQNQHQGLSLTLQTLRLSCRDSDLTDLQSSVLNRLIFLENLTVRLQQPAHFYKRWQFLDWKKGVLKANDNRETRCKVVIQDRREIMTSFML
ncbi:hypothetical protein FBU30_010913 [Linnemannia zychae]|nr:hypothetical protein FBU30_010913 [Linnemannia zychae]